MTETTGGVMAGEPLNYCVLRSETSLASAVKLVYLAAFVITCTTLFSIQIDIEEFHQRNNFVDADSFISWLNSALWLTSVFVVIHHIRLYLTVELIEDPTSKLHQNTISTLVPAAQGIEQLVRIIIIAFVGFKAYELISGDEKLSELVLVPAMLVINYTVGLIFDISSSSQYLKPGSSHSLYEIVYLANIFLLLLVWDAVIVFGTRNKPSQMTADLPDGRRSEKNKRRSVTQWAKDTAQWINGISPHTPLVLSHIAGLVICLAFIVTMDVVMDTLGKQQPGSEILPLFSAITVTYLLFIFYAAFVILDIGKEYKTYWWLIFGIGKNIFRPYYGESCPGSCFNSAKAEPAAAEAPKS